jgi:hypothetical protein
MQDGIILDTAAFTDTALVLIPLEYCLPESINAVPLTVLVVFSLGNRLTFLDCRKHLSVKLPYFEDDFRDRSDCAELLYDVDMPVSFIIETWCQPAFLPFAVAKSWLTIAQPIAPRSAILAAFVMPFLLIIEKIVLLGHVLLRLALNGDTDMLISRVYAKLDVLNVAARLIGKLNGERLVLQDDSSAIFQHVPDLAKALSRHEPFTMFADNKYRICHSKVLLSLNLSAEADSAVLTVAEATAATVVHIANVTYGLLCMALPLPSGMFSAAPQSEGLVEHPRVPICCCIHR